MKNRRSTIQIRAALTLLAVLSLVLSGIPAAGAVPVAKAQEYSVFGQMISGENAEEPIDESQYTIISVSTEEELAQLAEDCRFDAWSRDKYVRLENDIALQEHDRISIPSFGGIFDGGEHTVSGLNLTVTGSVTGLFRYVQAGGTVRNLSVSGRVTPDGTGNRAGILAGVNYGRIINCSVDGSVAGTEEIGGIAGVNEETGEIRRCNSSAAVTGDHYTGGICGSNKGILNNCRNLGDINTHTTEVRQGIEDISMEDIENLGAAESVPVHTDTGGVAGYSEGKIYYCINSGKVGYQHVGYNTGGIVGRLHQGYLQNCTNTGHILGRKDVGGIVGQMEPFIEITYLNDKLSEIDRETQVFFDLLEAAHEDLSGYSAEVSALTGSISAHLTNASGAGGTLLGTANELWYIYNQELTGIGNDLSRLTGEWADQAEADKEKWEGNDGGDPPTWGSIGDAPSAGGSEGGAPSEGDGIGDDFGWTENIPSGGADWTDRLPGGGFDGTNRVPSGPAADVESYLAALRRFGEGTSAHLGNLTSATNDRSGGINNNLEVLNAELNAAGNELQRLAEVMRQGGDATSANIDALMEQGKLLRRLINELRDDLFRYEGITVEDISDETVEEPSGEPGAEAGKGENPEVKAENGETPGAEAGKGETPGAEAENGETPGAEAENGENSGAEAENGETPGAEAGNGEDSGTEVENGADKEANPDSEEAYYDTQSFQQGKVTLCVNEGTVEADTNVGGITGTIATEYDFDPEDDITVTGAESFHIEQTLKAVVRESRNVGAVTGKKDYVGGIVGKADSGAVVSCESYGEICSTGGSYVGGIAGAAGYCIRNCYMMGDLSGKNYVGGIVGSGCDVFYSYAYPEVEFSGECAGAIAGTLQEDGILYGNYYVAGEVSGVDFVSYEKGAEPLTYAEFCGREGIPEDFLKFTVSFRVDGKELAAFECAYGDSIDKDLVPAIPEKEGYYGIWPDFDYDCVTGSRTLEAEYRKWVSSLSSQEKDENGRGKVLVQGEFLPEDTLRTEEGENGGTRLSIFRTGENGEASLVQASELTVRVLCEEAETSAVQLWTDGAWKSASASVMGSYLEFDMTLPGDFRIVQEEEGDRREIIGYCAVGGGAVMVLLVLLHIMKHRRKSGSAKSKRQIKRTLK